MSVYKLQSYRHDIIQGCCYEPVIYKEFIRRYPDRELSRSREIPNAIRRIRALVDYCLENDERAEALLSIVQTHCKRVYARLEEEGPKGPPERTKTTHTLTPAAMLALGWKGKLLNGAELLEDMELDQFLSRVTGIHHAAEDMWARRVILTEEYEELLVATNTSCKKNIIRRMLSDPDIPVATKHSIGLILMSHNMHIYGLTDEWKGYKVFRATDS
ncbi:unnamed protein product [Oreochromis niloticus]|nr:unnamed protein product [Mustela putorius furo]